MSMKIYFYIILLLIVLSGCVTSKWAYEYYEECDVSTSHLGFQALVACGKANISASCPEKDSCYVPNPDDDARLMNILDILALQVEKGEISEAAGKLKFYELMQLHSNSKTSYEQSQAEAWSSAIQSYTDAAYPETKTCVNTSAVWSGFDGSYSGATTCY